MQDGQGEVYNAAEHVDDVASGKWGAIYQGNVQDGAYTASRFLDRYGGYLNAGPAWDLPELQQQQFLATARRPRHQRPAWTAGGHVR